MRKEARKSPAEILKSPTLSESNPDFGILGFDLDKNSNNWTKLRNSESLLCFSNKIKSESGEIIGSRSASLKTSSCLGVVALIQGTCEAGDSAQVTLKVNGKGRTSTARGYWCLIVTTWGKQNRPCVGSARYDESGRIYIDHRPNTPRQKRKEAAEESFTCGEAYDQGDYISAIIDGDSVHFFKNKLYQSSLRPTCSRPWCFGWEVFHDGSSATIIALSKTEMVNDIKKLQSTQPKSSRPYRNTSPWLKHLKRTTKNLEFEKESTNGFLHGIFNKQRQQEMNCGMNQPKKSIKAKEIKSSFGEFDHLDCSQSMAFNSKHFEHSEPNNRLPYEEKGLNVNIRNAKCAETLPIQEAKSNSYYQDELNYKNQFNYQNDNRFTSGLSIYVSAIKGIPWLRDQHIHLRFLPWYAVITTPKSFEATCCSQGIGFSVDKNSFPIWHNVGVYSFNRRLDEFESVTVEAIIYQGDDIVGTGVASVPGLSEGFDLNKLELSDEAIRIPINMRSQYSCMIPYKDAKIEFNYRELISCL